jgi:hypothetical protein
LRGAAAGGGRRGGRGIEDLISLFRLLFWIHLGEIWRSS